MSGRGPYGHSTLERGLWTLAAGSSLAAALALSAWAAPPAPYSKEYTITIDATALNPPTWWQVPGVTPMIMTLDPDSTDAFRTTAPRDLRLKPGTYRFGTFTFDFPFAVTLEGTLDYAKGLDQCVSGRGTNVLTVRCSRTQPYGGNPEY
ncbi:MAG: hypothetical protein AB1411_08800 [Nitrospirota bacterium]